MKPSLYIFISVLALAYAGFEHDVSKVQRRDIKIPVPFSEDVPHSPRIIGGEEALANSIPQQVALFIYTDVNVYFCAGSLISTHWVLTAAHCVDTPSVIVLIAGTHRPLATEPTQQTRLTDQIVIHSGWNATSLVNDIALIYVSQPFMLNAYVQAANLPTRSQINNTFTGNLAILSGWGSESDAQQTISEVLRWVEVNIIANLICNIAFLGIIESQHLCSSGSVNGNVVGACGGDSGSPLILTATNTTVGIMSFGVELGCESGWPTVFVRVTSFLDWISANAGIEIQP